MDIMKKKEGVVIIGILILLVLCVGIFIIINKGQKEITQEYIPQEEISDEQLRQTILTLYFQNKETGELAYEARKIDVNELIKNPYNYIINELISGPKGERLEKLMPEGVRVNNIELNGDILSIDFSEEFVLNAPEDEKVQTNILKSIIKTFTELKEVNFVNILIDGEAGKGFNNSSVVFNVEND